MMDLTKIRLFDADHFYDSDLPDWYLKAEQISDAKGIDFHHALDQALACEHWPLTEDAVLDGSIEIRYWPSEQCGTFVLIETPHAIVEQIVILNAADWLPFLSKYLAPLITTAHHSGLLVVHGKIANTFIAWARHGEGHHVDRETGLSTIDLDHDRDRSRIKRARAEMAQAGYDDTSQGKS